MKVVMDSDYEMCMPNKNSLEVVIKQESSKIETIGWQQ